MDFKGQAALEWLITHAWSILIVLSVGATMFYLGVFEGSARPRFEGLQASGLQPVPDQVRLYSDGIMVFTVLNTRPYKHRLEFVVVAPIGDPGNIIQTVLNSVLGPGELGVFEINASNIYPVEESSVLVFSGVSAKSETVDFNVWMNESYTAGGKTISHVVSGTGHQIPYDEQTSPGGSDEECNTYCINFGYDGGTCVVSEPACVTAQFYYGPFCSISKPLCCCDNA